MKEKLKMIGAKVAAGTSAVLASVSMAFATGSSEPSGGSAVSSADIASVLEALQAQISVASVIEIVAYVLAAGIGLVFMWWAARKLIKTFMGAFRSGRLNS